MGLYLRAAGIPTYGVQGIFMDRDDIRFHGRDERVEVQSFYEAQTFLYDVVKRLASPRLEWVRAVAVTLIVATSRRTCAPNRCRSRENGEAP